MRKLKDKIIFVTILMMFLAVMPSITTAKGIKNIYPNEYKFWPVGSSSVAAGEWSLVLTKSNDSPNDYNYTYTITDTNSWQWHITIPINELLPGERASGTSKSVKTLNIMIPPFKTLNVHRRYITKNYYYEYQKGEIIQWDDNSTTFKPYGPPIKFYKTVVISEDKTSFAPINISLKSLPTIKIVYEDLSKWNLHGNPQDFYVNSDPYGNIVVLKVSPHSQFSPRKLYVVNSKSEMKDLRLPTTIMSSTSIVNGIDIFKNTIVIATFKTSLVNATSASPTVILQSQLLLYNYKTNTSKEILSIKDAYISAPSFSNDGKKIAYTEYKDGNSYLFVMNLKSGKKSLLYKGIAWPTLNMPNSAWSENGNLCFGNSKREFVVAVKKNENYTFLDAHQTSKIDWYYMSSPFFVSNDIAGFVDGTTSNLVLFNFLTDKVVMVKKLNVSQDHLVGVQYTNGKLLVVTVEK